jgi:SnoaL-like domain
MTDAYDVEAVVRLTGLIGDTAPVGDYGRVYADDAVWETASERQVGIEQIVAAAAARRADGATGPGTASRHIVTPMAVRVDRDDATVSSYFLFIRSTSSGPGIAVAGVYEDRLRRIDGAWKIQHRTIATDAAGG